METTTKTLNGIDIVALQDVVDTVGSRPDTANVVFRGRTVWDGGTAGDGYTVEMEQAGSVTPRNFTSRGDHPPALLGNDTGPTAGEALLSALGSCITATFASHATARGIRISDLQVEVEGSLDLRGFLQLGGARAGFQHIDVRVSVNSDADDATLADLLAVTRKASPVHDTISRAVAVTAEVGRLGDGSSS